MNLCILLWTGWYCLPSQAPAASTSAAQSLEAVHGAFPFPVEIRFLPDPYLSRVGLVEQELCVQFIYRTDCSVNLSRILAPPFPFWILSGLCSIQYSILCIPKHEYLIL